MFAVVTEFHDAPQDFKAFDRAEDARKFLKARLAAFWKRAPVEGEFVERVMALRVAASDAREAKRLVQEHKAALLVDSGDPDSIIEPYEAF